MNFFNVETTSTHKTFTDMHGSVIKLTNQTLHTRPLLLSDQLGENTLKPILHIRSTFKEWGLEYVAIGTYYCRFLSMGRSVAVVPIAEGVYLYSAQGKPYTITEEDYNLLVEWIKDPIDYVSGCNVGLFMPDEDSYPLTADQRVCSLLHDGHILESKEVKIHCYTLTLKGFKATMTSAIAPKVKTVFKARDDFRLRKLIALVKEYKESEVSLNEHVDRLLNGEPQSIIRANAHATLITELSEIGLTVVADPISEVLVGEVTKRDKMTTWHLSPILKIAVEVIESVTEYKFTDGNYHTVRMVDDASGLGICLDVTEAPPFWEQLTGRVTVYELTDIAELLNDLTEVGILTTHEGRCYRIKRWEA